MMLRKGPVCLSALYIAACAPAFAADPALRSAPAACPPAVISRHIGGRHGVVWHRNYSSRNAHIRAGGSGAHGPGGGLAWGLAPGAGQLGAAGLGYYHADNCWSYQVVYDRFGNYLGEQPANICLDPPPH